MILPKKACYNSVFQRKNRIIQHINTLSPQLELRPELPNVYGYTWI